MGFFDFNLYSFGFALAAFFMNLILTSWAVGIFVSGIVLRNGMGAESMAWTIMFLLLPLTCVYYPVSVLPGWLQPVAWLLPPTYVFEGMRALLIDHAFRADLMLWALRPERRLFCRRRYCVSGAAAQRPNGRITDANRRMTNIVSSWEPLSPILTACNKRPDVALHKRGVPGTKADMAIGEFGGAPTLPVKAGPSSPTGCTGSTK